MSDLALPFEEPRQPPNKRGYTSYMPGPFDYSQLAADVGAKARASANRINSSKRKHIVEVGAELLNVKAQLTHGAFADWIDRELNFSSATARNYMAAARAFAHKTLTVSVLPPAILYRLAGAPPEIRDQITDRIEAGEYVDRDEVHEAIERPKRASAAVLAAASEKKKKEAQAKRRRESRERNWRKEWEEEDAKRNEKQRAAACELLTLLRPHHSDLEISRLNALWRVAGANTVDQVFTEQKAGDAS